jgi:adenylate kinase
MEKKPFNLILLGDPASGKGTQSGRLIKHYRLYNFDMGEEVRKPSVRARYAYAKTTAAGKLAPTGIVRRILHDVIRTAPKDQGILFSGHPKMIGEARLAAKWLKQYHRTDPLVIYLHIPTAAVFRRAEKRRAYVGGKLVKRDDDSEQALLNRKKYYKEQISRVVAFFKKKYVFKKISGVGTEAAVEKRIKAVIDHYVS